MLFWGSKRCSLKNNMSVASSYARALFEVVSADPTKAAVYIQNIKASLQSRGHLKLMPAIASEYQKLEIAAERRATHSRVTPEKERLRVLLGLYKKLVETK